MLIRFSIVVLFAEEVSIFAYLYVYVGSIDHIMLKPFVHGGFDHFMLKFVNPCVVIDVA